MGVPTSEVGYTPAMSRREDHEVHKGHVAALGGEKNKYIKIKKYRNIILHVVLHGCKTWSLTLRVGHRLRVFGNRVLRKIFGLQRESNGGIEKTA